MPGNVTVTAGGGLIAVIPVTNSIIQEPIFMGEILYQYANLDLPFSPNDPGLSYTYNNTMMLANVTLAARFFNLIDEDSTGIFVDVGYASVYTGISGSVLGCLDVRNFGAVGNGVADDTAAVQAALNQASKNYQALVATGAAGNPGVPVSASGAQLYPDSVGVPGPLGSTIVCIPSGVYCRVFPRTWDFANIGTPPAGAAQYPPDGTGLCALFIDDGVSLEVDGGLILGFDINVMILQAQTNAALAGASYCDTMWILENKYAFNGGPFGPGQTASPFDWQSSLIEWETGFRNQNIQVYGTGFFDCGGTTNTTEFQTGGWLNECRGGAIRFCKCDNSQITQVTIQDWVSNQGIYWGHSFNSNVFEIDFQNSYGGSVFANNGTNGVQPTCGGAPPPPCYPPYFGNATGIAEEDTDDEYTATVVSAGDMFAGETANIIVVVVEVNNDDAGMQVPSCTGVSDSLGSDFEEVSSNVGFIQFYDDGLMQVTGYGSLHVFIAVLDTPVVLDGGYTVTSEWTGTYPQGTPDAATDSGTSVFCPQYCSRVDQVNTASVSASAATATGPTYITDQVDCILSVAALSNSTPLPPNTQGVLEWDFNDCYGAEYTFDDGLTNVAPAGTYQTVWNNSAPQNGGATLPIVDIALVAECQAAMEVREGQDDDCTCFPGLGQSLIADYRFFALVFDVMRQSTEYSNRFTNVNSAIGEYACFHTDFHDSVASQCGLPPYGTHFATDKSLLMTWTFPAELNVDGNRYANHYAMNKDLVWTPGMWITDGSSLRTMTPTGGTGAGSPLIPTVLTITTTSLPNGSIGSPYDVFMTAAGGTPPYMWAITAGALPPGLSMSPEGEISGTPTTTGTFDFTVQVTDSGMGMMRMMARKSVRMVL